MSINKVSVSCSSYLPKNISYWKNLKKLKLKVNFSDYGILVKNSNSDIYLITIFDDDLTINEDVSNTKVKFIINEIENLLKLEKKVFVFHSTQIQINNLNSLNSYNSTFKKKNNLRIKINKELSKYFNFFYIDLNDYFAKKGYSKIFDSRNWYYASLRLSNLGLQELDYIFYITIKKYFSKDLKVLAIDCDNTIWGGIIGEDGDEGIKIGTDGLGKIYTDIQKEILKIIKKGIIVVVVSKNNLKDVMDVFNKNKNMILKKKDITLFKVNWNDKSNNLIELAKELNISIDSFAFLDDSHFERKLVSEKLPMVKIIDLDEPIYEWPNIIRDNFYLTKYHKTIDDKRKTNQYKIFLQFKKIKENENKNNFFEKIKMKPNFFIINKNDIIRAAQMTQKTNQFNITTKRYNEDDIMNYMNNKNIKIFMLSLKDIFGDHGNIGLAILKDTNQGYYVLDTFLLSCRVLSRELEFWFLEKLLKFIKNKKLKIEYKVTPKNEFLIKNFLKKLNLKLEINKKHYTFVINPNKYKFIYL